MAQHQADRGPGPDGPERGGDSPYREIVEQSLQGIVVIQDARVVFANAAIVRMSGFDLETLGAMDLAASTDLIHPDEREEVIRDFFLPAIESGTTDRRAFRTRRADGSWLWVDAHAMRVIWRGRPALEVTYVDIDARKETERRLRESEERFVRVFQASPNPTLITSLEDGRVVDVNESFEAVTGCRRDDVVGRPAADLDVFDSLDFLPDVFHALRQDRKLSGLELPYRTRDGGERHGLLSAEVISIGGERCIIWQGSDVTELKRTQDALRESESRFRLLTESAYEYVTEVDPEGTVLYLSRTFTELLGWDRERFLGRPGTEVLREIAHPDDRAKFGRAALEAARRGQMGPVVTRALHRDGSWRWIETVGRRVTTRDGSDHVVTVTRDVSEQVRAQEERQRLADQVLQSQKLEGLGVLAGGIAHDFNNLLVGIQGNAELALLGLEAGHPSRQALEHLQRAAERASGLTRELLAYAGKARVTVETVHMGELAEEMAHLMRSSVPGRVSVEFDSDGSPCWVEADATQVRQVVLNLIQNAAEALEDGPGCVWVRAGSGALDAHELATCLLSDGVEPGDFSWVEVSDDGCGMDEEILRRIFDPFFTTKFQGRGLGLAGVLGIVRGHRGTLQVSSAPGQGTTFRILLPRSKPPARTGPEGGGPEEAKPAAGTVLVVDDEEAVRSVARRMLEARGYRVWTAESGSQALELAREHAGELTAVLLDLTMPGMGGDATFEALRRIRPDLPVVFCSGHSEEDVARRLEGRRRVENLPKPFRLDALLERLGRVTDPAAR